MPVAAAGFYDGGECGTIYGMGNGIAGIARACAGIGAACLLMLANAACEARGASVRETGTPPPSKP